MGNPFKSTTWQKFYHITNEVVVPFMVTTFVPEHVPNVP